MPLLYKPEKYAYYTVGDSLTEQEHADMCDANIMIKRALKGQSILTQEPAGYGYDDTTLDGLSHRIQKQQLEEELNESLKNEVSEEEAKRLKEMLPAHYHERIKVKRDKDRDVPKSMEPVVQSTKQVEKEPSHERTTTQSGTESR
ncbi:hypothetical protein [Apis mellifera associated microvirus 60]|nr:hypothetical protein [Apis mellifera associated microvirus 60]AZL82895.1 hypothetical protein [Apis mellifera associated microvirus 60]